MIGLLGFFIKMELGSKVTIVGSPGGMKSRFVVSSYSAKVAYAVYSSNLKSLSFLCSLFLLSFLCPVSGSL